MLGHAQWLQFTIWGPMSSFLEAYSGIVAIFKFIALLEEFAAIGEVATTSAISRSRVNVDIRSHIEFHIGGHTKADNRSHIRAHASSHVRSHFGTKTFIRCHINAHLQIQIEIHIHNPSESHSHPCKACSNHVKSN